MDKTSQPITNIEELLVVLKNLNPRIEFSLEKISEENLQKLFANLEVKDLVLPPGFYYDENLGITNKNQVAGKDYVSLLFGTRTKSSEKIRSVKADLVGNYVHEIVQEDMIKKLDRELNTLLKVKTANELLLEKGSLSDSTNKSIKMKLEKANKIIDILESKKQRIIEIGPDAYLNYQTDEVVKGDWAKARLNARNDIIIGIKAKLEMLKAQELVVLARESENSYSYQMNERKRIALQNKMKKLIRKIGRISEKQRRLVDKKLVETIKKQQRARYKLAKQQEKIDSIIHAKSEVGSEREIIAARLKELKEKARDIAKDGYNEVQLRQINLMQDAFEKRMEKLKTKEGNLDAGFKNRMFFHTLPDRIKEKFVNKFAEDKTKTEPSALRYYVNAIKEAREKRRASKLTKTETSTQKAPTKTNLSPDIEKYSVSQLNTIAGAMNIEKYSKLRKAELIQKLKEQPKINVVLKGFESFVQETSKTVTEKSKGM